MVLAQEESRTLGHEYIGTEHLLLGLIDEHEGVASRALSELGVSHSAVRAFVVRTTGEGGGAPSGHIPFTPRAKKALELSLRESLQLGHNYIGTEHLLLGLLLEGEGVGVNALLDAGLDLQAVRTKVIELMSVQPTHRTEGPTAEMQPPPSCPGCRSSLEGRLAVRALAATGDATGADLPVLVVYCRSCGRALGTFPSPSPSPPS